MKKNKLKFWIGGGIFCAAALLASIWYAVTFNDSRLVVPVAAIHSPQRTCP